MKALNLPQSFLAALFILGLCHASFTQNLAPNPSFESYSSCPVEYGNGGLLECNPWQNGNLATADFFNACAGGTDVWVPDNLFGSQIAHTGTGYTGFFTRESSIWREYVQAPLLTPCVAGVTYHVSFYVSLADNYCATANIGAHLSANPPGPANDIGTLNAIPQIQANLGFINDNQNWVLITGCFVAQGGEQWITIGNFYNNANTPLEPGCTTSFASYYYLDDITVEAGDPAEELELDLEEDFTTCAASYTIDPGVTGVEYHWSTGASTPTITVSETDLYILTITSGCASAVDSVEITFESSQQVQIGPPELFLCEGETFNISLDPSLGEYTWQDGSHSPVYTIITDGLYQVTLENACGISSDEIEITYGDLPIQFSLGDDISQCSGQTITFSFDPALGDFLWQDGNTSADYAITSPGIYSLTISNDCGSVSDQIEVTQALGPSVDLGQSIINFCEGETINISYNFDPGAGDYEWQDGNNSSTYVIAAAGTYSVTVTNECGSSQDEILITTSDLPAEFSLGEDIIICTEESISFSFDPSLGMFEWQDQSDSPDYIIETGGTYHLTISNSCGSVSDTIIVTEIAPPTVDLGQTINMCEGEVVEINLDPSLGDFLWQDGSTSPSYIISEQGMYEVTVTNDCGSYSDAVEVISISSVELDLGPDINICPSQLPFILDVSDSNATDYLWQDQAVIPIYTVTTGGVYAVTVSNVCFEATDQLTVIVEDIAPQVDLPADVTLCPGDTLTLTVGNALGDYLWQDLSTEAIYQVYQAGTYSLQVTNECGIGTDTIHVDYTPVLLYPDLGPDLVLCPEAQAVLHVNGQGAEVTWHNGSHSDTLIVNASGIYSVAVSNACASLSDTIAVSVDDSPPSLQLPDTLLLCDGTIVHVEAGIEEVTYLWSDGSTTPSIDIMVPGIYSLTVSNPCGTDIDSLMVVSGISIPSDFLPDSLHLCEGQSLILSPDELSATSYQWQDGATTASYLVSDPGWYILEMTYECGNTKDSTYVDMISAVPSFSLGNDTILCEADTILLTVAANGNLVSWQDGSSSELYVAEGPGNYFVTISNQCNSYSDSVFIDQGPESPWLDLGPDQLLCPGESILLEPDISDVSFQWSDGNVDSMLTVTDTGSIYLIVENECGIDSDTVRILLETDGPQIELGDTLRFCEGHAATIHGEILGVDYVWQDGSTSSDLQVNVSGLYSVTVTNDCGSDSDTVFVVFSGTIPSPQLGSDTVMCDGNSLLLLSLGNAETDIIWQDGSSSSSLLVTQPGTYILIEVNQCGTGSDTIDVTYQTLPGPINLGPDTIICPDDFILLNAPSTTDQLTWQDGSHNVSIIADQQQIYWLEIRNQCGVTRDEIAVSIDHNIISTNLVPEVLWCPGEVVTLDASQEFHATYLWNTGSTESAIIADKPGIFRVMINSLCSALETEVALIEDESCLVKENLYVPNVFSPNGDGLNDFFSVNLTDRSAVTSLYARIFDRWGNEVFESGQIEFKWDGTFRGKSLLPGVYTYVITAIFEEHGKNKTRQYAGDVTILN